MSRERGATALAILTAAGLLGILGDILLWALPWGVNVAIWIGALVAALIMLAQLSGVRLTGGGRWLIAPVLIYGASLAWRDSAMLFVLNLAGVLVGLAVVGMRSRVGRVRVASVLDFAVAGLLGSIYAVAGPAPALVSDIEWRTLPRRGWSGRAAAVGRGVLLATPVLVVFGGLFMGADAVFQELVRRLVVFDFSSIVRHLIFSAFWAWIVAGFLRQTLLARPVPGPLHAPAPLTVGAVEIGVVLGLLNALFLAFVGVQLGYFFGGGALVEATTGLTYAEYARRGFFELVTVAALVLPTLMVTHWLLPRSAVPVGEANAAGPMALPSHERVFRLLAGALVALLFIIMASAVQRMRLYQMAFGLTELRLYTTVFMGWLAVVFLWYVATELRGQTDRFAFGALAAAGIIVVGLNALNPDEFIARANAARVDAERPFDVAYVASLSADAAPALVAVLPGLGEKGACAAAHVLRRWQAPEPLDWRTWNWSRARAWEAVAVQHDALSQQAKACRQAPWIPSSTSGR